MKIRTYLGVSLDGYISTPDGLPAFMAPQFAEGSAQGFSEFLAGCSGLVMGRTTFEPALTAPTWPWPDLRVFVLTTQPLPSSTPEGVVAAADPAKLVQLMTEADLPGDIHLVGGQRTVQAFSDIGAIDSIGVLLLPILLGDGTRLTPQGSAPLPLRLESSRTFSDGCVEHTYTPTDPPVRAA